MKRNPLTPTEKAARHDQRLVARGGHIMRLRLQPDAASEVKRQARNAGTNATAAIHAAIRTAGKKGRG